MADPFVYAHENRDKIVWMSQNNNTIPTTPKIREAIMKAVDDGEHVLYPLRRGVDGLPEKVLDDLGLSHDSFRCEITNGGLEGLYCFMRATIKAGDEVIASDPSFLPIHHQVTISGGKVVELPIYGAPWKLTVDAVRAAMTERTKVILLIDPINPLGTEYTRDEVKAFADLAREKDVLLIHDITYHDFAYDPALATEFAPERTVICYSFSKNCGLAGLRVGAFIAPPDIMDKVKPYFVSGLGVSALSQRAALAALDSKDEWVGPVVETSRRNQKAINDMVEGIDGCSMCVYPSSSNTVCIDVAETGIDPNEIEAKLLFEHDVFVRGGPYLSKRFGPRFVRVSFSVPEADNAKFIAAFPKVIEALRVK